jgi:hypothetical protein
MLGLLSRWETEAFLRRTEAFHNYTMDDLERDITAISRRFQAMNSVADTSPHCFLILIGEIGPLPKRLDQVLVPAVVALRRAVAYAHG